MTLVQFIYNNNVIAQQSADIYLNQIDELKWFLAENYKCYPDEIETRYVNLDVSDDLSVYDVTADGIICFNSGRPDTVIGMIMDVSEDSDEFYNAILGKNIDDFIEKHLHFTF